MLKFRAFLELWPNDMQPILGPQSLLATFFKIYAGTNLFPLSKYTGIFARTKNTTNIRNAHSRVQFIGFLDETFASDMDSFAFHHYQFNELTISF